MRNHVTQVTIYDVSEIFATAYRRVATMHHALKAFEGTGLWPVNRHIFTEVDFLPSSLLNCALNSSDVSIF